MELLYFICTSNLTLIITVIRTVYSEFAGKLRAERTEISAIVVVFTVRPHGE